MLDKMPIPQGTMTFRRAPEPALPEAAWHGAGLKCGVEGHLAEIREELLCVHQVGKAVS